MTKNLSGIRFDLLFYIFLIKSKSQKSNKFLISKNHKFTGSSRLIDPVWFSGTGIDVISPPEANQEPTGHIFDHPEIGCQTQQNKNKTSHEGCRKKLKNIYHWLLKNFITHQLSEKINKKCCGAEGQVNSTNDRVALVLNILGSKLQRVHISEKNTFLDCKITCALVFQKSHS